MDFEEADKFIQFGCWNNMNISKSKPVGCLKKVMDRLHQYVDENKPSLDFMVIAGDNYYPDKYKKSDKTKVKIIYPSRFAEGIKLLPTDLPVHVILGNHDLETNSSKQSLFIHDEDTNTTTSETGDCAIIRYEKEVMQTKPNIHYNLFDFKRLKENTLLLMIDTSMYSDDVNKYLPCYNIFLGTTFATSEELINYQTEAIKKEILNFVGGVKNIIIIGHHPITGLKYNEKENQVELLNDIIKFDEVLKEIYVLAGGNKVNYYYLCADLHMYQQGTIELDVAADDSAKMLIEQYIVGTGGTKLDDEIPPETINNPYPSSDGDRGIKYRMKAVSYSCGFLECNIEGGGNLMFKPILLDEHHHLYGGRKTRRSKKIKRGKKTRKARRSKKTKRN